MEEVGKKAEESTKKLESSNITTAKNTSVASQETPKEEKKTETKPEIKKTEQP